MLPSDVKNVALLSQTLLLLTIFFFLRCHATINRARCIEQNSSYTLTKCTFKYAVRSASTPLKVYVTAPSRSFQY